MAGVYSKAYQQVWAGRVREDEAIGFFGHNSVALPPKVTTFVNMISGKEPTVTKDFLGTDRAGKRNNTVPALNTNIPNKVQSL